MQDALVAVFTRWPRLKAAGTADAYARRVILNSHISRWRNWGRHVSVADPSTLTETVTAPTNGSDALIARQILTTLPLKQRAAVFLRFYDDLTYRQIADILGCREATARSHVHRALIHLKTQLDKDSRT